MGATKQEAAPDWAVVAMTHWLKISALALMLAVPAIAQAEQGSGEAADYALSQHAVGQGFGQSPSRDYGAYARGERFGDHGLVYHHRSQAGEQR